MADPGGGESQKALNLILPMTSWPGLKLVKGIASLKSGEIFGAVEQVGTVHFLRLVELHEKNQLGFFTAYDGDFRKYIDDFIKCLAPLFDVVFKFVAKAPRTPVAKNSEEFIDWIAAHDQSSIGFYNAYPGLSVQDIRTWAAEAPGPVPAKPVQSPLTLILPIKTAANFQALAQVLPTIVPKMFEASDKLGTQHYGRFIPLSSTKLAFVSDYDGDLRTYVLGLATHLGPVLDVLLEHVVDPPPVPVQANVDALVDWIAAHNMRPSLYYRGYPTLTVKDVKARALAAAV